jgi:tetratricopeptide (TPR) repeat protein
MKKKRSSAKKASKRAEPKTVNVHQVIGDADHAMESLEMDRALSLYSAAATILKGQIQLNVTEANPVLLARVLLKLGEVKVSLENEEGARQDFEFATTLLNKEVDTLETHEIRASLFLYLGQLSSEQEALEALRKGICELQACIRLRENECEHKQQQDMDCTTQYGPSQRESLLETRRQLSNAFCTLAELFLTDLCFEEGAEQECEAAVQAAIKITEDNGEPLVDSLQTMASLRLSQGRAPEAARFMLQAYNKMKSGCEALSALVGLKKEEDDEEDTTNNQAIELTNVDAANNLPGFDFRCQTAKLLMECAVALKGEESDPSTVPQQVVECSDAAVQVLASLLAENDEVIEVWYLLGCAFAASSPPDAEAAAQYWGRALELLTRMKDHMELIAGDGSGDEEETNQLQEINLQIDEVHKRLKEIGHDTESTDVEMTAS